MRPCMSSSTLGTPLMSDALSAGINESADVEQPTLRPTASPEVRSIATRERSPEVLLGGAVAGLAAFLFPSVLAGVGFFTQTSNDDLNITFASGHGYMPSTFSELVHKQNSPAGQLFYAFSLIAGLLIFTSFYPYQLRNVYTGPALFPVVGCYWTTFRQIVPVVGLWMLIGVPTYPQHEIQSAASHVGALLCASLHTLGAIMMFLGFALCELKTLGMLGCTPPSAYGREFLAITGRERRVRQILTAIEFFGFISFATLNTFEEGTKLLADDWPCCHDQWLLGGETYTYPISNRTIVLQSPQLIETSSGWYLALKTTCILTEIVAGLSVIFGHIVVWYYCEERKIHYGARLLSGSRGGGSA